MKIIHLSTWRSRCGISEYLELLTHYEERAFSIGFIEGPLGRFWFQKNLMSRSPQIWKTSEPLLRMLTVVSRAFEEIMGGLELHPGALVRVGYPEET